MCGGIPVPHGLEKNLLYSLAEAGLAPPSPCGGTGTCGKCAVRLLGPAVPVSEADAAFFSSRQLDVGYRLACMFYPDAWLRQNSTDGAAPATLQVELAASQGTSDILSEGHLPPYRLNPSLRKKLLRVKAEGESTWEAALDHALRNINSDSPSEGSDLLRYLNTISLGILQAANPDEMTWTAVFDMGRLLALEPGDTRADIYAAAVDIGTTTVVMSLLDLNTGRELGTCSCINPQTQYGFDVLTRISHVVEYPQRGLEDLRRSIVSALNNLLAELCPKCGVAQDRVYAFSVAANTAMEHILLGVSPVSLGRSPFRPVFTEGREVPADAVGLKANPAATLYCLPAVSAYIGSDIVAGAYAAGLHEATDTTLFIDIGTNGEIILAHEGRLSACSCAAGPALEGMNITCGMRAAPGAVEAVKADSGCINLRTIQDSNPVGLCGSGILSAITEFLRIGAVTARGNIVKPATLSPDDPLRRYCCEWKGKPALCLSAEHDLYITQKDIRQVQLAKGALLSGFLVLLEENGLCLKHLDRVLIAGQFGAHLPVESLVGCGIIPQDAVEKVVYLGNTSKSGACLALLSEESRGAMERLADRVSFLELGTLPDFDRRFVACLDFPSRHSAT